MIFDCVYWCVLFLCGCHTDPGNLTRDIVYRDIIYREQFISEERRNLIERNRFIPVRSGNEEVDENE